MNKKNVKNFEELRKERIEDDKSVRDWKILIIVIIISAIIIDFILELILTIDYLSRILLRISLVLIAAITIYYFSKNDKEKPKILS